MGNTKVLIAVGTRHTSAKLSRIVDMNLNADQKLSLLFGRRSIRLYLDKPIDEEAITSILRAGMAAPSAAGKDPWRVVVVRQREQLERLAAVLPHGKMVATAAVGFVVCGDMQAAHDHQLSYLLQDCSAAIQNMLLSAHALGLGACWLGIHPRQDRIRNVSQLLRLPEFVIPISAIALGWPAEQKEPRTRYNPDYVHHERW